MHKAARRDQTSISYRSLFKDTSSASDCVLALKDFRSCTPTSSLVQHSPTGPYMYHHSATYTLAWSRRVQSCVCVCMCVDSNNLLIVVVIGVEDIVHHVIHVWPASFWIPPMRQHTLHLVL